MNTLDLRDSGLNSSPPTVYNGWDTASHIDAIISGLIRDEEALLIIPLPRWYEELI